MTLEDLMHNQSNTFEARHRISGGATGEGRSGTFPFPLKKKKTKQDKTKTPSF